MARTLLFASVVLVLVVAHLLGVPTFAGIVADFQIIRKFFPVPKSVLPKDLGKV